MRNAKAIFHKQTASLIKNPGMLAQAGVFLLMIIVFAVFLDNTSNCDFCIPEYICRTCIESNARHGLPDPSMTGMLIFLFTGLTLISSASALVTEDKTTMNLRFMSMADVKPVQYALGTGASMMMFATVIPVLFALVGRYFGMQMFWFWSIAVSGSLVSVLLGLTIGLSKRPALTTPLALILGIGPMLSQFNERLAHSLRFTYTQQIRLAVSNLDADLTDNFLIIAANGAVILVIFIWMHRKKNLA